MVLNEKVNTIVSRRFVQRHRGVVLALLGPDGVGKTTVSRLVEKELAPRFGSTIHYHLRPFLGRRHAERIPPAGPYNLPPRNSILSMAKVLLWLVDFAASYLVLILPRLRKHGLVIFDRIFEDILVDPLRYRYGGPLWFPGIVSRLFSSTGKIAIFLDAPVEIIQARKHEVSLTETVRQRAEYLRLARRLKNSYIVNAARPLEDVVADVVHIALTGNGIGRPGVANGAS